MVTRAKTTLGKCNAPWCDGSVCSGFECVDCAANTMHDGEYYMITDKAWASTGMKPDGGMLCIGCVEARISRKLTAEDFPNYPINTVFMYGKRSARLQDRLDTSS
jgi:hypothetical protein